MGEVYKEIAMDNIECQEIITERHVLFNKRNHCLKRDAHTHKRCYHCI